MFCPCFQHILLDSFRQMRLKYENHSLRRILLQTLKQHSDDKSLIAKTFNGSRVKVKATSPVQVIKNKKKYFQLCLDWTNTLILTTHFWVPQKVGGLEGNLSTPVKAFFSEMHSVKHLTRSFLQKHLRYLMAIAEYASLFSNLQKQPLTDVFQNGCS